MSLTISKHYFRLHHPIRTHPVVDFRDGQSVLVRMSLALSKNEKGQARAYGPGHAGKRRAGLIVRVDVEPGGPACPVGRRVACPRPELQILGRRHSLDERTGQQGKETRDGS